MAKDARDQWGPHADVTKSMAAQSFDRVLDRELEHAVIRVFNEG